MLKPPKPAKSEGFDKELWIKDLKNLAKEYRYEDADKFRTIQKHCEFAELEKVEKKSEIALMRERDQIKQFIERQRQDVGCTQILIKQPHKTETLEKIKTKCQMIEQNLKNFKIKSRQTFQSLVEEEKALMQELSVLEDKFETYSQVSQSNPQTKRTTSVSNRLYQKQKSDDEAILDQLKQKIDDIDKQVVQLGGVNCGWEAADHKDYLKIRAKHNGRMVIAFNQEVMRAVPMMDEQKISEHTQVYSKYLELTELKKELIQKYKDAKQEVNRRRLAKVDTQNQMMNRIDKELGIKRAQSAKRRPSVSQEIKKELKEWKDKKEQDLTKEKSDQFIKEEQEKLKLRQKYEKERAAKKELVEEFKFQKEMQRIRDKQLEDFERRKSANVISTDQQERIRKRETELFTKKALLIQHREELKKVKQELIVNDEKFKNVESKLLVETKAAETKKREKFDPNKDQKAMPMTMGGRLPTMGQPNTIRAMPAWRQGV